MRKLHGYKVTHVKKRDFFFLFPVKRLLKATPSSRMGREEEHYFMDVISLTSGIALSGWLNTKFLGTIKFGKKLPLFR